MEAEGGGRGADHGLLLFLRVITGLRGNAAAAPPTGRPGITHRAAVLMLRDRCLDAARGWEGEYKTGVDREKMCPGLCGAME